MARAGVVPTDRVGGGTLFTEPVLVVNQKAKFVEVNAEYAVFNQHGQRIGAVQEVGQSIMRNAVSVRSKSARKATYRIVDQQGRLLMVLFRPEKIAKATVVVRHASGAELRRIVQTTFGLIGKVRFDLTSGSSLLGSMTAGSWRSWDFTVKDAGGLEIARITKDGTGRQTQSSTKRDKYVVEIYQRGRPVALPSDCYGTGH